MGGEADECLLRVATPRSSVFQGAKSQKGNPSLPGGKGTLVSGDGLERRTEKGS